MPVAALKRLAHFGAQMSTSVARYPDLSRAKATKNVNASVEIEVRNVGLLPTVVEESTGLA